MKIALVLGTRPEIIKMASLIRECEIQKLDFFIIHSNQHYSENLDKIFFEELNLTTPKYNLQVGSSNHGNQTGKILIGMEEVFLKEKPTHVLTQGDTNTVLACALAASKLDIKVGHVEAGLRSYNRKMPEETNRIVTDHVSDFLFCPTNTQKIILEKEGLDQDKIHIVGNTVVDAVLQNIKIAQKQSKILEILNIQPKEFILATAHRSLNVDNKESLQNLINCLNNAANQLNLPLVYPIHPRTKKMLKNFNINPNINTKKIKLIEPLGYLDFLMLQKHAKIILTDSGGIQEEACVLKTPCITLREETERPETVEVGANIITGININKITKAILAMLNKPPIWENPYGDGTTAKQIIEIIKK
ncbi:UDP-N-acetylglucosamine 2-epimerase (non-hydrolyzing) [archaeon]|jgi:UDP-N-acetylglucosamine 2-epimerase (non-hydrolysing)|nr:UDP-N-acetylglucosamine 2-epimerase (non-hydrolyzing) [archaeon]MBT6697594.1 UDP-N-acetylglucosamine 2-epimerase (non-hydrolyzing) [archaeon]